MGEFFHFVIPIFRSSRRRAGCYTLALACLCVGMWLRSQSNFDLVTLSIGRFDMSIGSCHRGLIVLPQKALFINQTDFGQQCHPRFQVRLKFRNEPISNVRGFHWSRMKATQLEIYESDKRSPLNDQMVSYRSITIPLTLIAAFLLLKKPKTSTSKKLPEPNPNGGA
jgi:hypothetical protein